MQSFDFAALAQPVQGTTHTVVEESLSGPRRREGQPEMLDDKVGHRKGVDRLRMSRLERGSGESEQPASLSEVGVRANGRDDLGKLRYGEHVCDAAKRLLYASQVAPARL